jgi:hypothetical protein
MHLELISKFQVFQLPQITNQLASWFHYIQAFQLPQITNQLASWFHYIQAFNNNPKGACKVVMVEMYIKQNYN